jgi:hypothetical protein
MTIPWSVAGGRVDHDNGIVMDINRVWPSNVDGDHQEQTIDGGQRQHWLVRPGSEIGDLR